MAQLAAVGAYHVPASLNECLDLLAGSGDTAVILAGGQAILPLLRNRSLRPDVLVDLSGIAELHRREAGAGGSLVLGAMCRHRDIYEDRKISAGWSALADAAAGVGDLQVQNRGTIGGNLVFGTVLTDMKQVVMCLDARLRIVGGPEPREVSAREIFGDAGRSLLEPGELLESIAFPALAEGSGSAYRKFGITTNGRPVIGVAAALTFDADRVCTAATIVVGGLVPAPHDARIAAQVLIGQHVDEDVIVRAAQAAAADIKPQSDARASAAYRRQLVRAIGQEVLLQAWKRATEAR
ncbi:MAG: FAD binding domain-containing protein [Steroidobacteraceae bacterium]|nr:FAD binding domain-containing protein [Steroidobacteraceae bacterium]